VVFVIENKTDLNRSPCFMIIFIHVEGLFGLGHMYMLLYTPHIVCAVPLWRCSSTRSIIRFDEIFLATNRDRPHRQRHIEFSIFWHTPASPVGIHDGRLSKWKISFPWGAFPSKHTYTRMRAAAIYRYFDDERIYLVYFDTIYIRIIIQLLVSSPPRRRP
jgi:hypothetical protein